MNKRTCLKLMFVAFLVFNVPPNGSICVAQSSSRTLITAKSIGPIRLGMTVARIRKTLSGATLSRTSDGEGAALIAVERRGKTLMILYAGETDPDSPIDERAVVEYASAVDAAYRTSVGVHPGMSLREVEQKYGKLKRIELSEIESREYATFARQPAWLQLRVMNDKGMAGIYPEGQNRATRYAPATYVLSISITTPRRGNH